MRFWYTKLLITTVLIGVVFGPTATVFTNTQVQQIVTLGTQIAYAQESDPLAQSYNPHNLDCGSFLDNVACDLVLLIVFDIWYGFTNQLARLTASLADHSLWLSLQSQTYQQSEIVDTGWVIVRDITNIFFIVSLLYIGMLFIIKGPKERPQKLFFKLLISALLINFSLFGAKVIVDATNILARSIYTSIEITGLSSFNDTANESAIIAGKTEVSRGILNITNPQTILLATADSTDRASYTVALWMFFVAGIINILLLFMFLTMAILFLARTIGLIVLMIFVPFSIVADLFPPLQKKAQSISIFSFEGWTSEFTGLAFQAPIYVFFLYLIIMFVSNTARAGFSIAGIDASEPLSIQLLKATMPMLIIFFFLLQAKSVTKALSGQIGGYIMGGINKVTGFVGGLALTAASAGLSAAGGAIGKGLQASAVADANAAQTATGFTKKRLLWQSKVAARVGQGARTATFDPRNINMEKIGLGKYNLATVSQNFGPGINFGKGSTMGYDARVAERARKAEERINKSKAELEAAYAEEERKKQIELNKEKQNHPDKETLKKDAEKERDSYEKGIGRTTTAATVTAQETIQREIEAGTAGAPGVGTAYAGVSIAALEAQLTNHANGTAVLPPPALAALQDELNKRKQAHSKQKSVVQNTKFNQANEMDKSIEDLENELNGLPATPANKDRINKLKEMIRRRKEMKDKKQKEIDDEVYLESGEYTSDKKQLDTLKKNRDAATTPAEKARYQEMIDNHEAIMKTKSTTDASYRISSKQTELKDIKNQSKKATAMLIEHEIQQMSGYFVNMGKVIGGALGLGILGVLSGGLAAGGILAATGAIAGAAAQPGAAFGTRARNWFYSTSLADELRKKFRDATKPPKP